ncbi:unnamed protein product [Sphagnum jensenii]|jgi:hypothetical protein|uniref:Uncharacterized protein n=1 Tax=Sphagnum jensenii TaxID=128206 RepID=A0ABP0X5L8_9BRYO
MKTGSRITSVQIMLLLVVFFLCNAGGLQVESRSIPAKFTHQLKLGSSSTQKLQNFSGSLSSCSPPPISYSSSPYNYYSPPPSSPTYHHSPNWPVYSSPSSPTYYSPSPYYVSPVPHESPSSPTIIYSPPSPVYSSPNSPTYHSPDTPHQLLQLIAIVLHHLVVTPMLLRPQYSMRRQQLLMTTVLDQLHISGGY